MSPPTTPSARRQFRFISVDTMSPRASKRQKTASYSGSSTDATDSRALPQSSPFYAPSLAYMISPASSHSSRTSSYPGQRQPTTPVTENLSEKLHSFDQDEPVAFSFPKPLATPSSATLSLTALEEQTHTNRLAAQQKMVKEKGTNTAYSRHIQNYEKFWTLDQARRVEEDPAWTFIPSHPITVTKAAIFLQYETTRSKVCI